MKKIPDRIQAEFKVVLDQKHIPPTQQGHYLKWLRYYRVHLKKGGKFKLPFEAHFPELKGDPFD